PGAKSSPVQNPTGQQSIQLQFIAFDNGCARRFQAGLVRPQFVEDRQWVPTGWLFPPPEPGLAEVLVSLISTVCANAKYLRIRTPAPAAGIGFGYAQTWILVVQK